MMVAVERCPSYKGTCHVILQNYMACTFIRQPPFHINHYSQSQRWLSNKGFIVPYFSDDKYGQEKQKKKKKKKKIFSLKRYFFLSVFLY